MSQNISITIFLSHTYVMSRHHSSDWLQSSFLVYVKKKSFVTHTSQICHSLSHLCHNLSLNMWHEFKKVCHTMSHTSHKMQHISVTKCHKMRHISVTKVSRYMSHLCHNVSLSMWHKGSYRSHSMYTNNYLSTCDCMQKQKIVTLCHFVTKICDSYRVTEYVHGYVNKM